MVKHIILWTLKDEFSDEEKNTIKQGIIMRWHHHQLPRAQKHAHDARERVFGARDDHGRLRSRQDRGLPLLQLWRCDAVTVDELIDGMGRCAASTVASRQPATRSLRRAPLDLGSAPSHAI